MKHWLQRLGRRELGLLVLLFGAAGGTWGFVELADEVISGETHAVDTLILLSLRSAGDPADPLGPRWLEEAARDFTALGGVGVTSLIVLAACGLLWLQGKRRAMMLLFASVAGGLLVSTLLKLGFDRPRPDLVPHGAFVYTASFPSGHSMMSAVAYLTLGALLARVQPSSAAKIYVLALAVTLTVLVGISRVYLGVHWPTDVLAGWTAGAVWAGLMWAVALWLQRRGRVES